MNLKNIVTGKKELGVRLNIKDLPKRRIAYLAPALAMILSSCTQTQAEWSLVGAGVVLFFIGLSVLK